MSTHPQAADVAVNNLVANFLASTVMEGRNIDEDALWVALDQLNESLGLSQSDLEWSAAKAVTQILERLEVD